MNKTKSLQTVIVIAILSLCLSGCERNQSNHVDEFFVTQAMAHKNNLGVGLMGQFNYDAAKDIFDELTMEYPSWIQVKINLAIATLNRNQKGDTSLALKLLDDVLSRDKNNLHAHYLKGILLQHSGKFSEAIKQYELVLQLDKNNAYAAYFYAQGLQQTGLYQDALSWYQKAERWDPYLRSAYYGAFKAAQKLNKSELARDYLDKFQALKSNPRAQIVETKYTRMGKLAEVITFNESGLKTRESINGEAFQHSVTRISGYDFDIQNINITAADIVNGTAPELFISTSKSNSFIGTSEKKWTILDDQPINFVDKVNTALWGDYDNNGLTDVFLLRNGQNQLWKNTGDGHFQYHNIQGVANDANNSIDGAFVDTDHDGDLDLIIINSDGTNTFLINNLNESFRDISDRLPIYNSPGFSKSLLVFDFDRDRDTDILIINDDSPHIAFRNELLWNYVIAEEFKYFVNADIQSAVVADIDANGESEIYTLNQKHKLSVWKKTQNYWQSNEVIFDYKPGNPEASSIIINDVTGDGHLELILADGKAWSAYQFIPDTQSFNRIFQAQVESPLLFWTELVISNTQGISIAGITKEGELLEWAPGTGRLPFSTIVFSGLEKEAESMRSNASGIGTYYAARTQSRWTIGSTFKAYSVPGQSLQPVTIGLGNMSSIDYLALTWSDGVYQTELNLSSGYHAITETQRQLASCPVLFVWNGTKYEFVSDILGVGGLGFAVGPGEYAIPRPWENYLLPRNILKSRNGYYEIMITEPMEEVMYFDSAQLIAYDVPPNKELAVDERMGTSSPYPTGNAFLYTDTLLPESATNDRGDDVLRSISYVDKKAAPVGMLDHRFLGLTKNRHHVELIFENAIESEKKPALLIDGWVEYPYSQTSFSAWQAGNTYLAADLEFMTDNEEWTPLYQQFGYPAGMPRQMSLPLNNLPDNVTHIRLSSNMEIYWDRIALVYQTEFDKSVKTNKIPISKADVLEVGFAKRTTGTQRLPYYDFNQSLPLWDTRHATGFYTEFGEATELVSEADSALAIIGPGEGMKLYFPEVKMSMPDGWTRYFILETKGWVKDMDLYTQHGETVLPLPADPSPNQEMLHQRYNTRYR